MDTGAGTDFFDTNLAGVLMVRVSIGAGMLEISHMYVLKQTGMNHASKGVLFQPPIQSGNPIRQQVRKGPNTAQH